MRAGHSLKMTFENRSPASKPSQLQSPNVDNLSRAMRKTKFGGTNPFLNRGDQSKKMENKNSKSSKSFYNGSGGGKGGRRGNRNFNMEFLEPTVNVADVPAPPSSTILSTASVPDGGKIVSLRDPAGKIQVRIEYERVQILKLSASPYSILPPACIKTVVTTMPELVASFPVRHCYP